MATKHSTFMQLINNHYATSFFSYLLQWCPRRHFLSRSCLCVLKIRWLIALSKWIKVLQPVEVYFFLPSFRAHNLTNYQQFQSTKNSAQQLKMENRIKKCRSLNLKSQPIEVCPYLKTILAISLTHVLLNEDL